MRSPARMYGLVALLALTLLVAAIGLPGCMEDEPDADADAPETPATQAEDSEDETEGLEPGARTWIGSGVGDFVGIWWVWQDTSANVTVYRAPTPAGAPRYALDRLLAGPTAEDETAAGDISTAIPPGTELLGLQIEEGIATVDLSEEFEDGGGTFSVTARLAQVVYTLCQFAVVDAVVFSVEGSPVTVFSSEGIVLDGPQVPEDYLSALPLYES